MTFKLQWDRQPIEVGWGFLFLFSSFFALLGIRSQTLSPRTVLFFCMMYGGLPLLTFAAMLREYVNRNFPGWTACDLASNLAPFQEQWFRVHLCL